MDQVVGFITVAKIWVFCWVLTYPPAPCTPYQLVPMGNQLWLVAPVVSGGICDDLNITSEGFVFTKSTIGDDGFWIALSDTISVDEGAV